MSVGHRLRFRGELCMGFGSVLSLAAFLLLIFVHVGNTNTTSTPRKIAMATVNVSAYGDALAVGFAPDPINGLYATNASLPLAQNQGIRDIYQWGLYSYCAYLTVNGTGPVSSANGTCSNSTAATPFLPYDQIVADMSSNWTMYTGSIITGTLFRDDSGLGSHTKDAYYCLIIGTVLLFVSLILGLFKRTFALVFSSILASVAAALVCAGAGLWAVAISQARQINTLQLAVAGGQTPLGITVDSGLGLTLTWAAFGCMTAALIPYWISSCTYRG
ncbi:hypothetical protein PENSPDRAFT_741999 [Peniophora sp. CONT]|nr:hypothetical protein PENSPDRAFT_741999 [Peniophora sp. CONT]